MHRRCMDTYIQAFVIVDEPVNGSITTLVCWDHLYTTYIILKLCFLIGHGMSYLLFSETFSLYTTSSPLNQRILSVIFVQHGSERGT